MLSLELTKDVCSIDAQVLRVKHPTSGNQTSKQTGKEKGCQEIGKLLTNVSPLPAGGGAGFRQACRRFENFGAFFSFKMS